MFCPNCGTQVPEESRFCFKCGYNLSSVINSTAMSVSSEPVQQEYNTPQDVINRFNHALELNAQGNYEAAKNIFEELSSCGIAPAQMELAFFYIYGQCCEKMRLRAFS